MLNPGKPLSRRLNRLIQGVSHETSGSEGNAPFNNARLKLFYYGTVGVRNPDRDSDFHNAQVETRPFSHVSRFDANPLDSES
jgi:hypothetical protein